MAHPKADITGHREIDFPSNPKARRIASAVHASRASARSFLVPRACNDARFPKGYRRVRTYGWLSPAAKKRYEHLSALLGAREKPPREVRPRLTILRCPRCQAEMIRVGEISRAPP